MNTGKKELQQQNQNKDKIREGFARDGFDSSKAKKLLEDAKKSTTPTKQGK